MPRWILTSPLKKTTFRNLSDWLFLSNGSLATSQSLGIDHYRTFEPGTFQKWMTADQWCSSEQLLDADRTKSHVEKNQWPPLSISCLIRLIFVITFKRYIWGTSFRLGLKDLHSLFFTHNPLLNNLLWLRCRWDGWKQKKQGGKQIFFMWNKKGLQPERGAGVGDTADAGSEWGHEEGESKLKSNGSQYEQKTAASHQICHSKVRGQILKHDPRWLTPVDRDGKKGMRDLPLKGQTPQPWIIRWFKR